MSTHGELPIQIASNLSLPLEAVTQTFAVLAKRGAGKTHTATVMVEQMVTVGLPVIVVDPVGVWWGLRHGADGKSPGLPVYILGGEHADLPLEETAGPVVADFVVESRRPVVLDLGLFSKNASRRFMTDFAERLYQKNRAPLHLVLDEADAFAPQRVNHGGERLLGSINDLVRRGRARGLGVTLISQRPALVNKDVLTQIEVLIALRMTSPQDRDAIERWVEHHADEREAKEVLASLASLAIGEAWVWSPGWLGLFKRVQIAQRKTFDSSATPKVGQALRIPKGGAEVDLEALRQRIAATVEKSIKGAAHPPREHARIAQLERELAEAMEERSGHLQKAKEVLARVLVELQGMADAALASVQRLQPLLDSGSSPFGGKRGLGPREAPKARLPRSTEEVRAVLKATGADSPSVLASRTPNGISGPDRRILTVLAQFPAGRTKVQVAILTKYAHQGGAFCNYLSGLRTKGFIEGSQERLTITEPGLQALGPFQPLPTGGSELLQHWLPQLGRAERLILETLTKAYPQRLTKREIGQQTEYAADGGSFLNAISRLRTLSLLVGRDEISASPDLIDQRNDFAVSAGGR